ncbi:hypothetical protein KW850_10500 [Bacillus sp. sid0103]|uniref:GAP1-N2 domain-containing protein n=1 Tax=Bacillus sp. sid0103 TaxID=2856337 RepID=UPI001C4919D1|nr:hypothetical protein [Bacillus sp. sid0103]MBV7505682.1 hypothetical protein [Bacillus sp. sid0103]
MTGKLIAQQMYTRERRGIFHDTDGYDTIAISETLDKAFVKKYLHPFCMYHAPKILSERGEKDPSLYPESVTLFQPETGDLVIGQAVFVPADFTGSRSTYFMHNYIIPPGLKDEWVKQPERLFQWNEFQTSYDVESGMVLPDVEAVEYNATYILAVKDELLVRLAISEDQFKQLLYAVMTSIAGKKKVFISLDVPLNDYTNYTLLLLELLTLYLPYAHRRKLGAISFTSAPESKNYIHVTFYEPGTLNTADRSIEKQFIFDFAAKRISGLDIGGQAHEYLDYALDHFSKSERVDAFLEFADQALAGLPEEQKLELSSYYQLTDLFLTLSSRDMTFYAKNKLGFLHSLQKFLQVNSAEKPDLVDLFLNLLHQEIIAADPKTDLDYIQAVISINSILRTDEAISFILETLKHYQQQPLFHKLWKVIEQEKLTYQSIVLFISEHPDLDALLESYLMERFKALVGVDEILSEIKRILELESPYLLANETFKSVSIKKLSAAITYHSFKDLLAIRNFSIDQDSTEFNRFKIGLLAHGMIVLLRSIRLEEFTVKEILSFGQIFTKGLNVRELKDAKVKENYLITNALYEVVSNPAHAETYNLGALTGTCRGKFRSTLKQVLRGQSNPEYFPLLFMAFETEGSGVDYQGLLEYLIKNSDDKTILSFIRGTTRLLDLYPFYRTTLKKYLISHPESIWKNKALRKELKSIKNYSLKNFLKEVETETAAPLVKFLKQYGLKLSVALLLFGGAGGGSWYGLNQFFIKDKAPAPVVITAEDTGAKDLAEKPVDSIETLDVFKPSQEGTEGQTFTIDIDGKKAKTIYGQVQNGKQDIYLTDRTNQSWSLALPVEPDASPFDKNLILKEGYSLSSIEHDFTGDGEPEVVLAASDNAAESYIWIFAMDGTKNTGEPITPLLTQKGKAEVQLEGNKLILSEMETKLIYEYSQEAQTFLEVQNQ